MKSAREELEELRRERPLIEEAKKTLKIPVLSEDEYDDLTMHDMVRYFEMNPGCKMGDKSDPLGSIKWKAFYEMLHEGRPLLPRDPVKAAEALKAAHDLLKGYFRRPKEETNDT